MARLFLLLIYLGISSGVFSQENNYWNTQYGANSTLLGGAAVSSYCDNGAMYYNPATMSFKDSGNIYLSANLYKIETINFSNALGKGMDLNSANYGISPQLLSGNLYHKHRFDLGAILLTRNDIDFAFNQAIKNTFQMQFYSEPDSTHAYHYIASFEGRTRLIEQWAGISCSYQLNPRFAIGITNFVGYRFQRFSQVWQMAALGANYTNYHYHAESEYTQIVSYDNFNYISKAGAVYQGNWMNLGMAVTAPSFNIFGIGRLTNSYYFSNLSPSWQYNFLIFDNVKRLRVQYKTPFSVSAGLSLKAKSTKLYISAEYFAMIKPYTVISTHLTNKNSVQFNAGPGESDVIKSASPVFNAAIGIEQKIAKNIKLLIGLRTDATAIRPDSIDISYSNINLWHGSFGVKVTKAKRSITIGITGSYGERKNTYQMANLTAPDIWNNLLMGDVAKASTHTYQSAGLVVGFSY
jgi:hypothetical protein